jgi:hypothetical protein
MSQFVCEWWGFVTSDVCHSGPLVVFETMFIEIKVFIVTLLLHYRLISTLGVLKCFFLGSCKSFAQPQTCSKVVCLP